MTAAPLSAAPTGLRRPLALLLLGVLCAQIWAWTLLDGYQLADCVEYLDRAHAVGRGERLDPGTARSFAFSALLVPVVWLAELVPGDHPGLAMTLARLLQMAIGLLAVRTIARWIGERHGAGYGLAAGALLGFSPVFLRYSIAPLSSTAALLAILVAVVRLDRTLRSRRGTWPAGFVTGLGFSVAIWMAYQNVLVVGAMVPCLLFARPWRSLRHLGGVGLALGLGYLLQASLDLLVYGSFGSSLHGYLSLNVFSQLGTLVLKAGFPEAGSWIYENLGPVAMDRSKVPVDETVTMLTPPDWYFRQLGVQFLAPVASALVLVGVLFGLLRRNPTAFLLAVTLGANVLVMSMKGSKSFRLWMPFLSFFPAFAAIGLHGLVNFRAAGGRPPRWRVAAGALAVTVACALGLGLLWRQNLSKYGPYWRAIEQVNRESAGRDVVATSAYDWAARYREAPNVELAKFPHHLDQWKALEANERNELLEAIAGRDYLLGHLQIFTQDPAVIAKVNEHFEIAQVFHDYDAGEELEPVYLLRRRTGAEDAMTFFEVRTDTGPGQPNEPGRFQAGIEFPGSVDFRRREGDAVYQMVFLGYDVQPGLIDDTQAWITFHWYAGPLGDKDYRVVDRFTDGRGGGFEHNRQPAYGAYPTSRWNEGEIVSTGFLSRLHPAPLRFGGPYRRGDSLPLQLWLAIAEFDENDRAISGLNPFRPSAQAPIHKERDATGRVRSDEGRRFTKDGLMLVGGFFLDLVPDWRVPDDGRPIEVGS